MRPLFWLVFVIPFLLTCKKEADDSTFKISGIMTDSSTGLPLSNQHLKVFEIWFTTNPLNPTARITWLGECVTDSSGRFELSIDKSKLSVNPIVRLGCNDLPSGYTGYALRSAGNSPNPVYDVVKIALDVDDQNYENSEDGIIEDNTYYTYKVY